MSRSFEVVEEKLYETHFFLEKLRVSSPIGCDARYYFSAFVSAARSITLALQATMSGVTEFDLWYTSAQNKLKVDPLACFFKEIRNDSIHKGLNPLNHVTVEHLHEHLTSQMRGNDNSHVIVLPCIQGSDSTVLSNDAVQECEIYFKSLLEIIFECYDRFKCTVDTRWYFTSDNFLAMDKTFRDAVIELEFPSDWVDCAPEGDDRWRALRKQQPPCQINDLFSRYLGLWIADPDDTNEPYDDT